MSMSVNLRWRTASPSHHAEWGEAMITQCEACRADHFVHADRLGQDSMHYPHGCSTRPKKQQMQWTKRGAHLLLQMRVKTLNQELGAVFRRWYPDLLLEEELLAA